MVLGNKPGVMIFWQCKARGNCLSAIFISKVSHAYPGTVQFWSSQVLTCLVLCHAHFDSGQLEIPWLLFVVNLFYLRLPILTLEGCRPLLLDMPVICAHRFLVCTSVLQGTYIVVCYCCVCFSVFLTSLYVLA